MKKKLSIILTLIMVIGCCSNVFAAEKNHKSMFYNKDASNVEKALNSSEVASFEVYDITPVNYFSNSEPKEITKSSILELCEEVQRKNIASAEYTIYTSDELSQYLYNFKEFIEISERNGDILYIQYITDDNKRVCLSYDSDGLVDKSIYDDDNGELVYISDNSATASYSNHYEISDELKALIDECLESGNIEKLNEIPELNVVCEDGLYAVEEILPFDELNTSDTRSKIPTSNSKLLSSLKSDFPMYNKKLMSSTSKKCEVLNKNLTVQIKDDRNSYSRVSADWKSFAAGAAVTAVSAFIGWPLPTAELVLAAAGVSISAASTILSQIDLCRTAVYSFSGNRYGFVYDTTVYNANVLVKSKKSSGKFTGGFDKNGDFTWVISKVPIAWDDSTSKWATTTMNYYNNDLKTGSGMTTFRPE